jgi:hypothetical protein
MPISTYNIGIKNRQKIEVFFLVCRSSITINQIWNQFNEHYSHANKAQRFRIYVNNYREYGIFSS